MKEKRFPLATAQGIARVVVEKLAPACERIAICGSIRRQVRMVTHMELVVIPRWAEREAGGQADLFAGVQTERYNALHELLLCRSICRACEKFLPERPGAGPCSACGATEGRVPLGISPIQPGIKGAVPDGMFADKAEERHWKLWLPRVGMEVDVFLCTPETWGANLMVRTGSDVGADGRPETGFAPAMLGRWRQLSGGLYHEERLLGRDGRPIETPEEEDVFEACEVPFIPPDERKSASALRRAVGFRC